MSTKSDRTLQKAAKLVENALELDVNNSTEEAYVTYLESISFIASSLLGNRVGSAWAAKTGDALTKHQILKLVGVARQCLDRIETLTEEEIKDEDPVVESCEKNEITDNLAMSEPSSVKQPALLSIPRPGSLPDVQINSPTRKYSSILEAIDWVSPEEEATELNLETEISPLERAKRDNKLLVTTYQPRLSKAKTAGGKANLRLELQRRIIENLQMARQKQEAFLLQLKEQKRRELEKVTQAVRLSGNRSSMKLLTLVKETLEYEQKEVLFAQLRKKLDNYPENVKLISIVVKKTLQDQKHPLSLEVKSCTCLICDKIRSLEERGVTLEQNNNVATESASATSPLMDAAAEDTCADDDCCSVEQFGTDAPYNDFIAKYRRSVDEVKLALDKSNETIATLKRERKQQKSVLRKNSLRSLKLKDVHEELPKWSPETRPLDVGALRRQFENIVDGIHESFDILVHMFVLAYGKAFESDEAKEICYSELEQYFYPFFWPPLMHLCRIVNRSDERKVEAAMERLRQCTLSELGYDDLPSTYSCSEAVGLLKQVPDVYVPSNKLELLVKVAKVICKERLRVEECTSEDGSAKSISADDLLPLLSYACILSKTPQLISECYLLEALIHQKNLMGEGGYCLTSLLMSLHFIQTVEKATVLPVVRLESTV